MSIARRPFARSTRKVAIAAAVVALVLAMIPAGAMAAQPDTSTPATVPTSTETPVVTRSADPSASTTAPSVTRGDANLFAAHPTIQLDPNPAQAKVASFMKSRGTTPPAATTTAVKPSQKAPSIGASATGKVAPSKNTRVATKLKISPSMSAVGPGEKQTYVVFAEDAQGHSLGNVTTSTKFTIDGSACAGAACSSLVPGIHQVKATRSGLAATAKLVVNADTQTSSDGAKAAAEVTPPAQPATANVTISGRVTNSSGTGIQGIQVSFTAVYAGDPPPTTNATGNYSISVPTGSTGTVLFIDPSSTYVTGWWTSSGVSLSGSSVAITVGTTNITGINAVLTRAVQVKGRITNGSGAGVAGIFVDVCSTTGWPCGETYTDATGNFTAGVLENRDYRLRVMDNYSVYGYGYYGSGGYVRDYADATLISVGTATVTGINLVVPKSVHITGKVTNAAGQGLALMVISCTDLATGYKMPGQTDSNGNYSVTVTPGGEFFMRVDDPRQAYVGGYYSNSGLVYVYESQDAIIVGSTDKTVPAVVLGSGVKISGKVKNESGSPVSNATVFVASVDSNAQWTAWADSLGQYMAAVPGNDDYTVCFADSQYRSGAGCYSGDDDGFAFEDDAVVVAVGSSAVTGVNVQLPALVHAQVRVTDAGGRGLAGVSVAFVGEHTGTHFCGPDSDASGNVACILADEEDYTIRLFDSKGVYLDGYYGNGGYTTNPDDAEVIPMGSSGIPLLTITMPAILTLHGTVTNEASALLKGIEVITFDPSDGTVVADVFTDAAGHWSATVQAGMCLYFYDVTGTYGSGYLGDSGFTYDLNSAIVVSAATVNPAAVNVALPPSIHLSGKVTGAGGTALDGVDVYLCPPGLATYYDHVVTDNKGDYSFVVPPGDYSLAFFDPLGNYLTGYWTESGVTLDMALAGVATVEVTDLTGIDAQLQLGLHIRGTVTDEADQPIGDIEVDLFDAEGYFLTFEYTDEHGDYSLLVAPGPYYIGYFDLASTYATGFWSGTGFTVDPAMMGTIDVAADVTGIDVTMPLSLSEPTNVTATAGDKSAVVTWTAPLHDGGAPITSYAVVNDVDYTTCTWTSGPLTCTVTGLANGTVYAFSVYAENVGGPGAQSDASNSVTPAGRPGAPTHVTAAGTIDVATIGWAAASSNGSPIKGYTATVNPGGLTCTTTGALTCSASGLNSATTYSVTVTATNDVGTGPASSPAVTFKPRIGSTYVGLTPNRVVDTRNSTGLSSKLSAYTAATFQVTGLHSSDAARNVPSTATAVTGILSVSGASYIGWLALTPEPDNHPGTSTINFPKGDARSTGVTVPLGSGGKLSVTYGAPAGNMADIIFDLTGYFVANTTGSTYVALTPNRLVDSRPTMSGHTNSGLSSALTAGQAKTFQVTGRTQSTATNVPAGAVAVTGTLTVTGQTTAGYLTLGPDALNNPDTTSLFFPKGDNRATGLTVKLDGAGTLGITFSSTTAGAKSDVVFDVTGYFMRGTSGATYVPLTPNRIVDNRSKLGIAAVLKNHVAAAFAVINRVPGDSTKNVPSSAVAITGTLTVTGQTYLGWLALTQTANNNPTTSSLNFPKGDNRATGVTAPLSPTGTLSVTYGATAGATTYVVFDVTGYFLG